MSHSQITLSPQDIEATNTATESRQKYWLQTIPGAKEIRATNGLGQAVHYQIGRIQTGKTRTTRAAAKADLDAMPDATDYAVMEVLSEPVESPAAAMERIIKKQMDDCRKFCMGVLA